MIHKISMLVTDPRSQAQADDIHDSGLAFLTLWKRLCKESIRRGGMIDKKSLVGNTAVLI